MIDLICARRSVSPKLLNEPAPTREEMLKMVAAACAAPDHGQLAPTRFVGILKEDRDALGEVFVKALLERNPNASIKEQNVARQRAMNGAGLMAIVANIDDANDAVPPHEQWISVGAALQNLLLAANSLGYQNKIVTGARIKSRALRKAFELDTNEILVGFVVLGIYTGPPKERPRPKPDQKLSVWRSTVR